MADVKDNAPAVIPEQSVKDVPSLSMPMRGSLDESTSRYTPAAIGFEGLFATTSAAKVWKVASEILDRQPSFPEYPEHTLSEGPTAGRYQTKPSEFWTCGFFPGCLYAILERSIKYPRSLPLPPNSRCQFHQQLQGLCRAWNEALHINALRRDTHDLGFIVQPALRMDWELTGAEKSLESVIKAGYNLVSRYSEKTRAIRSWDRALSRSYNITDIDRNFLIIIDSMCNLDLIFYVGHHTGDHSLIEKATSHAHVVRKTLVRDDWSTYHVANLSPQTGEIQHRQTHQGYSDGSCWTRGQAWAILGFAQTYVWTKDPIFLATAGSLAHYFIERLSRLTHSHPFVPPWDFDAPVESQTSVLRDTSAGMIAANGLLILHQALAGQSPYLQAVLRIVEDTLAYSLCEDGAKLEFSHDGRFSATGGHWDTILKHSTANNNENALLRYSDHGLVYADYYFLELGNKLLRMGLI